MADLFRIIKGWLGYAESNGDLPRNVASYGELPCDVFFCHSKHINGVNRWALHFKWENQHATYELEKNDVHIEVTYSQNKPPINYKYVDLANEKLLDPNTVHNVAMSCSLNGQKFMAGWDQCQEFIEEICDKLGIQVTYDENSNPEFLSYFFNADVYFCHCPVPYINTKDVSKRHWALYFNWKHKSVRYELGKNGGYIKAECTRGDIPDIYSKDLLCSGKWLQPEEVHEAAMNCSLNNTLYSAGWNNCQIWVQEVADKLDIDVDYEMISGVPAFIGHLLPVRLKNAKPARL